MDKNNRSIESKFRVKRNYNKMIRNSLGSFPKENFPSKRFRSTSNQNTNEDNDIEMSTFKTQIARYRAYIPEKIRNEIERYRNETHLIQREKYCCPCEDQYYR